MGALALFREVAEFIAQSVTPTRETRQVVQSAAHLTYFLCPTIAIPFFLAGLHLQWMHGYMIAAILTIIPMAVLELARRMAKVASDTTEKFISLAATPHTWFAISNYWLAILVPGPEYIPFVYIAAIGITIFLTLMGRWDKPVRWYKPLTAAGVVLPTIYATVMVISSSLAPATTVGALNMFFNHEDQLTKDWFGQNFDQRIYEVIDPGLAYWREIPIGKTEPVTMNRELPAGTLLWRTERESFEFRPGVLYGEYALQIPEGLLEPSDMRALFPVSKVRIRTDLVLATARLDSGTAYYPDSLGVASGRLYVATSPRQALVTNRIEYILGDRYVLCRTYDRGNTRTIWVKAETVKSASNP